MEKTKIVYEGFFVRDEGKELMNILRQIQNFQEISWKIKSVDSRFFHITTQFRPRKPHLEWYGMKAKVQLLKFASDKEVRNPNNQKNTIAEGFLIKSIMVDDRLFQTYLNQKNQIFHITTGYSEHPVDTNYVNWDKKYVDCSEKTIDMMFGGYTSDGSLMFAI